MDKINDTYILKYQVINKELGYVYIGKATSIYYISKNENLCSCGWKKTVIKQKDKLIEVIKDKSNN